MTWSFQKLKIDRETNGEDKNIRIFFIYILYFIYYMQMYSNIRGFTHHLPESLYRAEHASNQRIHCFYNKRSTVFCDLFDFK